MFLEPYSILIVLVVTMALFVWGYWRYDVVALIALTVSVAIGAVPFDKVYSGLSNTAVITVACVMVISAGITRSGILNTFVRKIDKLTRYPVLHVGSLTVITAVLSAFMNNVGALALMMPIAIKTANDTKRPPSMLLMPIALGSALGGLSTVIGTPPNLLVSAYRQRATGQPFSMFDFSHVGVLTALIGVLFIAFFGWRLLPKRKSTVAAEAFSVQDYITELKITKKSKIIGKTVREFEALTKADFSLIGLIRKKHKKLVLRPTEVLQEGDLLILECGTEDLQEIIDAAKLELAGEQDISPELLRSDDIGLLEGVVTQGSRLEGRSSQSMRLRSRYQMNLLAISREGKPFKKRLQHVSLQAGDVVLLQGPQESLREKVSGLGLLPLVERDIQVGKRPRAYLPLFIFAIAIVLAATQLLPVQVAFGGAVLFMLLFNVIPVRALYDNIDWPIIVLLAAMIPIGNALQTTGGTALISHYFTVLGGHYSPKIILALLMIVTMILSDFMNNAATTVVMAPIAVSIANALQVHIDPFLMAVAIGASCSFLTPIGHQNNTLVLGPGGYKFSDYIRLGLPTEILIVITALPLILWAWPL